MENSTPPVPDEALVQCAYSKEWRPQREMVLIGEHWIAIDHKNAYVQFLQQGGDLGAALQRVETPGNLGLTALLSTTWKIYKGSFWVIASLYLTVWMPCNLLIAYVEAQHWIKDDLSASVRLNSWVEALIGVIATGAILHVARSSWNGLRSSYGEALRFGLSKWGLLLRGQILINFATGLGLLLLIIPGILVLVRSVFLPSFLVEEGGSATNGFHSSWQLAKGHFWRLAGFSIIVGVLASLPTVILLAITGLLNGLLEEFAESSPLLDQAWMLDWIAESFGGITFPFATIFFFVFYKALCSQSEVFGSPSPTNAPRLFTKLPVKSPFPPVPNSGNLPS